VDFSNLSVNPAMGGPWSLRRETAAAVRRGWLAEENREVMQRWAPVCDLAPLGEVRGGLLSRLPSVAAALPHPCPAGPLCSRGLAFPRFLRSPLTRGAHQSNLSFLSALAYPSETDLRIGRVLGFADPSSFSRSFSPWTGMSPQRFRGLSRTAPPDGRARPLR